MNIISFLYSSHGQLGLFTITCMMVQLLLGVLVVYAPGLFGGIAKAKKTYKYHRISGYLLLVLLWTTTLYGVKTPFLLVHDNLIYIYSLCFIGIFYSFLPRNSSEFTIKNK